MLPIAAVGGAYTLASQRDEGRLLVEIGLREDDRRVRCKFVFKEEGATALELEQLAIVREALSGDGSPAVQAPGGGLYDPPPGDRTNYCSLYCEGGLTLVFPARCAADAQGFLSVDWIAGKMRYQADRKFELLDGTLTTLELSEIQTEDAERFPSEFTQPGR